MLDIRNICNEAPTYIEGKDDPEKRFLCPECIYNAQTPLREGVHWCSVGMIPSVCTKFKRRTPMKLPKDVASETNDWICPKCKHFELNSENWCKKGLTMCGKSENGAEYFKGVCMLFEDNDDKQHDAVNAPSHYVGKIELIDYLRDKLTPEEFTGFCMGNVLKYSSRWRKKDGIQDLKKARVYLNWAIESAEKLTNP